MRVKCSIQNLRGPLAAAFMTLGLVLVCHAQSDTNATVTASKKLRVLLLSGEEGHARQTSTPFLRQALMDSDRFEVRVCEIPQSITAKTLTGFDVVVVNCPGASLEPDAEAALEAFASSGKGVVLTRDSMAPIGSKALNQTYSQFAHVSWPETTVPQPAAPFRAFDIKRVAPTHPILQGLLGNLRTADRPLLGFSLLSGAEVLAATDQDQPVLFTARAGQGRVFCTLLGRDVGAMQEKAFTRTFLRGTVWAAGGSLALMTDLESLAPATNGVRVLVITGGHDHEASFYGLFDGAKDLGWPAVADSQLAFHQDLRAKYDVLVFYDFTRDLDEGGRKHLRDFVESGKGIIVLHHGILDFQKWPWWSEEVVGGRYRLDREGDIPNSTVKFGEEHLITPAGPHPITEKIGPFHLIDETYKGLFISPKIQPLLLTDNPTSDRTVAWIGPCTTSRVVFIQLGHDHVPIQHPSYRALVHNAILWSAGRL